MIYENNNFVRVLVIDDDQEDFFLTEDSLFDAKYTKFETEWASTYDTGLQRVLENEHDVYVIDYYLGVQNGLDLMQEAMEKGAMGPFILLTGQGEREIDLRAMELGAMDFIVKGDITTSTLERSILYAIRHASTLKQLRLSEERYLAVLQSQTELICRFTPDLKLTFVNDAYCQYFGKSTADLIGRSFLELVPAEDHDSIHQQIDTILQKGEKITYEHEISTPNGDLAWQQWTDQPIFDAHGHIVEFQSVGFDITERKTAELTLLSALRKEKELGELKSRFVSMASHEFRTPLTMIMSTASFVEMAWDRIPAEKALQKLAKIQNTCIRMTDLIEEVLVYAKAEADRTEFRGAELNCSEFCAELVEDLNASDKQGRQIILDDRLNGHNKMIADERLLHQILTNLLSNAVKYSPKNAQIDFKISPSENQILFDVIDQGIGIPDKDKTHLFEPFHRATNSRDVSGTGLGLAITKKAVELHQGKITFTSEKDKGSHFTVELPIQQSK